MKKILLITTTLTALVFIFTGCTLPNGQEVEDENINQSQSTNQLVSEQVSIEEEEVINNDSNLENENEYYFEELGFSIKLPFEKKDVNYQYTECSVGCDEFGYSYLGTLKGKENNYNFLGSTSQTWSPSRAAFITDIYDLEVENDNVRIITSNEVLSYEIQPIEKLTISGINVYLFNANNDYYKITNQKNKVGQMYAAVFQIKNNEKFKTVIICFEERDLSLDNFKKYLQTIIF